MEHVFKDIEDYGIVGNLETCGLIGRDGSVDWLCFPYLESPAQFAALLDTQGGGQFSLRPVTKYKSIQVYEDDTNILKTTFTTPLGIVSITDFMPVDKRGHHQYRRALFRKISWEKGTVELGVHFKPRWSYGAFPPKWTALEQGLKAAEPGSDHFIFLQISVKLELNEQQAEGIIQGKAGDQAWTIMSYNDDHPLDPQRCAEYLQQTKHYWQHWARHTSPSLSMVNAPWQELVIRSGLVLKLLANPDNGAIAAAATTSLPERIGGLRNWDYRYAWIRDSAFTVQALFHLGHEEEARAFRRWIKGVLQQAKDPEHLKIMYGLHGEADLEEKVLQHLSGYKDSSPVRIGNAAADQHQHDIFGELINALYETTRYGETLNQRDWEKIRDLVNYVIQIWKEPDSGIWEMRSGPNHFVYSKLMCWVALDRGIKMAQAKSFQAPLAEWKKVAAEIKESILSRGFNPELNSFVQSFDSEILDATNLLIPFVNFLPPTDERVLGTIEAVKKHLLVGHGLVLRYQSADGLPGQEGSFLLCSFWLVKALSLVGKIDEAEHLFKQVLSYISSLGLLSEEVDGATRKLIGNFPQAFSHIGLINSALYLGIAKGQKHHGPKPVGL